MKVLEPGHLYELESMDGTFPQQIQFIEKGKLITDNPETDGKLATIRDGTTNEEILKMLINRLTFLNAKLPSDETKEAIQDCRRALAWLNWRSADRILREVDGTANP